MAVKSTDLDFLKIKQSLRQHFKKYDDYKDYDFEGSGLASIMDVLAYNTHVNGLIANMAINESFLSSSQLRSSAVSHAETLGYTPKSNTASTAYLDLRLTTDTSSVPQKSVPGAPKKIAKGHAFFAEVGDTSYRFVATDDTSVVGNVFSDGTITYDWTGVEVKEGTYREKTFLVSSEADAVYVIPDTNVDVSTMVVTVSENSTTTETASYSNILSVPSITPDSRVYMIKEISNGYYEMFFSDGNVLGQAPAVGSVIRVSYLQTLGEKSNGAVNFSADRLDGLQLNVTNITESGGGSNKESLASIKRNAPRAFSTQQRLVTADDYSAMIQANYGNDIQNVIAWGGADNQPPEYGKVFVSLDFHDGVPFQRQDTVKESIKADLTSNLSIMSIDTEFVNPELTFLEIDTVFQLDAVSKIDTPEGQAETVMQFISDYVKANLGTFGTVFRRSNLLSAIDSIHPSILNSRMEVKGQQRFTAIDPRPTNYELSFPFALASPDKDIPVITTTPFQWQGSSVMIKNELGSHRLQIFNVDGQLEFSNIGYYDEVTGQVIISALDVETNLLPVMIKVSAVPANSSTIRPLRNYIIELDETASRTRAIIDEGTTKVTL